MSTFSTYVDIFAFLRATTGLETASLIGNKGRLSSDVAIGATSLPVVPNITIALNQFDQITIFDGASSEVVEVGANTSAGSSNIPLLQPLQSAQPQYATYCSDGASGSLGDQIASASSWIEVIAQQSLFQQTYNETLHLPSLSASIDNQGALVFSPRHFPVQSDSAITIESSTMDPITYDASQVIFDSAKNLVTVPWLAPVGSGGGSGNVALWSPPPYSRRQNLYLQVTYVAGYNPLPPDIRDCAILRTSSILARRQNPTGAIHIVMGKRTQSWNAGKDIANQLDTTAMNILLSNYKRKM